jgi:hypothetical protein
MSFVPMTKGMRRMSEPAYRLTDHAKEELERRGIPHEVLQAIMESPGQILDTHSERKAYQSKIEINGKLYVVRIIVELTDPLTVVTAYRTSKVEKYWSDTP